MSQLDQDIKNLVSTHSIFEHLDQHELNTLQTCFQVVDYVPNQAIFLEGDLAQHCYFILSGQVEVYKKLKGGRSESLTWLQPGNLFGHIAIIDHKPRSASCRFGNSGGRLWSLSIDTFEKLFAAKSPLAYKLIDYIVTDLAKRLRGSTKQLRYARHTKDLDARHTHSLRAAQLLAGHQYTDEELNQLQVVIAENQSNFRQGDNNSF